MHIETQTTTGTAAAPATGAEAAVLELKLVGDITGRFIVARYQRGYRWGAVEVGHLLDDLWTSNGSDYCLQPVVVKRRAPGEWELVDGQQRLTTLYLIFFYMQREGLQSTGANYKITYETRPDSETYLSTLDAEGHEANIDFFHIFGAYDHIRKWFEKHAHRRQHVANKLHGFLFESVRVIWYEAPAELDATTLFTRLNVGRIPLTDAELVKALLLSKGRTTGTPSDRSHELAAQWDGIERDLRNPELWAFVADADPDDCPTRITLLLDTLADTISPLPGDRRRPLFHTFETLRRAITEDSPGGAEVVWNRVVTLHALVLGWFADRSVYHKVGYLVALGERIGDLVRLAKGSTRSSFEKALDNRISRSLGLSAGALRELTYDNATQKKQCERALLLMNVETVRRLSNSAERYSFRLHRAGAWSLEHIHAQQAEGLNRKEQWSDWLRLHRDALATLDDEESNRQLIDQLIEKVNAVLLAESEGRGGLTGPVFQELAQAVTQRFTADEDLDQTSVHSIFNLALLSSQANSALGNSVFEVKRQKILALDRQGAYLPICTRRVFLKYYSDASARQLSFWGPQDRDAYERAMLDPHDGVLQPYLQDEPDTGPSTEDEPS